MKIRKGVKASALVRVNKEKRMIWLEGTISNRTAFVIENGLKILNSINNDEIKFFISGEGGDFFACLKILTLIDRSPGKVTTIAFNFVRSGCFFITQTNIGKRMAVAGTKFVFHHAVDTYLNSELKNVEMNQNDYDKKRNELQRIDAAQLLIFCQRGKPGKKIFDLFNQEASINTRLALRLKLIDELFDKKKFLHYKRIARGR